MPKMRGTTGHFGGVPAIWRIKCAGALVEAFVLVPKIADELGRISVDVVLVELDDGALNLRACLS